MDKAYKTYLIGKWKEAEEVAKECGCTSNEAVITFFKMMTQPYHFWKQG